MLSLTERVLGVTRRGDLSMVVLWRDFALFSRWGQEWELLIHDMVDSISHTFRCRSFNILSTMTLLSQLVWNNMTHFLQHLSTSLSSIFCFIILYHTVVGAMKCKAVFIHVMHRGINGQSVAPCIMVQTPSGRTKKIVCGWRHKKRKTAHETTKGTRRAPRSNSPLWNHVLNSLNQDIYLDRHQISHTHKYLTPLICLMWVFL